MAMLIIMCSPGVCGESQSAQCLLLTTVQKCQAQVMQVSNMVHAHIGCPYSGNWLLVCMVPLHLAMVISCLACCAVGPKMLSFKRLILCQ
jgi:hypothetical protein